MARILRSLLSALVNGFPGGSVYLPPRLRLALLRRWGATIGSNVRIRPGLRLLTADLVMGDGVFINEDVTLNNRARITLGDQVALAPGVLITTIGHEIGPPARRQGEVNPQPVLIQDGTWVGARAVILPGVTVGPGCIVAAGAVVNRDCKPNGLYAGVPAKRIRDL